MTPFDSKQLMAMILTPMQEVLWRARWYDLIGVTAIANIDRAEGDPLRLATVCMLTGEGAFADLHLQARLNPAILQQSAQFAKDALQTLLEDGKITPPYSVVKQGINEPCMQFFDRLRTSLERAQLADVAREALFVFSSRQR